MRQKSNNVLKFPTKLESPTRDSNKRAQVQQKRRLQIVGFVLVFLVLLLGSFWFNYYMIKKAQSRVQLVPETDAAQGTKGRKLASAAKVPHIKRAQKNDLISRKLSALKTPGILAEAPSLSDQLQYGALLGYYHVSFMHDTKSSQKFISALRFNDTIGVHPARVENLKQFAFKYQKIWPVAFDGLRLKAKTLKDHRIKHTYIMQKGNQDVGEMLFTTDKLQHLLQLKITKL